MARVGQFVRHPGSEIGNDNWPLILATRARSPTENARLMPLPQRAGSSEKRDGGGCDDHVMTISGRTNERSLRLPGWTGSTIGRLIDRRKDSQSVLRRTEAVGSSVRTRPSFLALPRLMELCSPVLQSHQVSDHRVATKTEARTGGSATAGRRIRRPRLLPGSHPGVEPSPLSLLGA